MAFPIRDVIKPSALSGQLNGRIDPSKMIGTAGQAGGATVTLITPAHRAWRALASEALKAGHVLKIGWPNSSYRNYEDQKRIFLDRYRTAYKANTDIKWWNGQKWYRWYGATAAAPGTSNHGWGLAVDVGEERDGDGGTESVDSGTVDWLVANEQRFGFSHELQSEPWHIRYFAGDDLPQAVLDYERSGGTAQEDEDMALIIKGDASMQWWITDGFTKRYIGTGQEASEMVYVGLAKWDTNINGPFTIRQGFVDAMTTLPADGIPGHAGVATLIRDAIKTPEWTAWRDDLVNRIAQAVPAGSGAGGASVEDFKNAMREVINEKFSAIFDLPGE